ncbi:MAG: glycine betaine/L-proline ABC transporter substrate-binding protein ProX [Acidimicrobiia bacterium]|nr:glycine betaine/L-proline ABC transporter substrate-binding protein ProX [Acidimicrobiia bacterium]
MNKSRKRMLAAGMFAAVALVAAACGGSDSDDAASGSETSTAAGSETAEGGEGAGGAGGDEPGAGVEVTMARADWSTGYFQAAIYYRLLSELGYEVSDPSQLEMGPSNFYTALAEGEVDFWVNSWYPGHKTWLENELSDGSTVGEKVSVVGEEMLAGGLQGYLVTKSFAEKYDLKTLDDLDSNAEALAEFDATDPKPGDGKAQIYGCQESFTCDDIIQNQIAFSGWQNIEQTVAGYDAMVADAVAKVADDQPMVIYTWTPSAYITQLIPGETVMWIGVEDVVDDSNPAGLPGGAEHDQRPGTADIGPDECLMQPCQIGWVAADIQVTARNEFLDANPAAKALFENVKLSVIDVSLANVEQANGKDTNEDILGLADQWIADNRDTVDGWLEAARAAA